MPIYLTQDQVAPFITDLIQNIKLGIWDARVGPDGILCDMPTEISVEAIIIQQPQAIPLTTTTTKTGNDTQGGTTTETMGTSQGTLRTSTESGSNSTSRDSSETSSDERTIEYESFG